jgi:hypothetical protein
MNDTDHAKAHIRIELLRIIYNANPQITAKHAADELGVLDKAVLPEPAKPE